MKARIVIGLPMFQDISPENKVDAMRFAFVLGRQLREYDFMIAWRTKSEQFRARNYIVNKAREFDADYLFFFDDDHIIDWQGDRGNTPYMFLNQLLEHLENNEKLGIVGALYYHRGGGAYKPVIMHERENGIAVFYDDHEIENRLQEVDIQGGGVMLIRMKVFDKMTEPYFKPETLEDPDSRGTDLQICKKVRELGWKVACDTSIVIGHESSNRIVVCPNNRHLLIEDTHRRGIDNTMMELSKWNRRVMDEACRFLNCSEDFIVRRGGGNYYTTEHRMRYREFKNPNDYYRSIGDDQVCRQVMYHQIERVNIRDASIINMLRNPKTLYGLDYGCGIGIVGFEALRMDNNMDFVDVSNCRAFEFLQWRVERARLGNRVSYTLGGPYDFVLLLDVIEHIKEWEPILDDICGRINPGGAIITNFFIDKLSAEDFEHVNLDREGVSDFLQSRGFLPSHMGLWLKRDNFLGGAKNVRNFRKNNDNREG